MKVKKSIVIEKMDRCMDSILNKLLEECNCDCGKNDLKIISDDEDELNEMDEKCLDEELEDVDEQAWRAGQLATQKLAQQRQLASRAANIAKSRGQDVKKTAMVLKRSSSGAMI